MSFWMCTKILRHICRRIVPLILSCSSQIWPKSFEKNSDKTPPTNVLTKFKMSYSYFFYVCKSFQKMQKKFNHSNLDPIGKSFVRLKVLNDKSLLSLSRVTFPNESFLQAFLPHLNSAQDNAFFCKHLEFFLKIFCLGPTRTVL